MRAGGTGGSGGLVGPFGPIADAYVSRGEVNDGGRNKKRRYLARPTIHQVGMLAFDDVKPAYTRSDMDAYAGGILRRDLQAGHLDRLIRRRQRQVDKATHLLDFFFFDEIQRIEILD